MGCSDSALKAYKESLAELEATIVKKPWFVQKALPTTERLGRLDQFVASLEEANKYFRHRREDASHVARIAALAEKASQDLVRLVDVYTIRCRETLVLQTAKSIAERLDRIDNRSLACERLQSRCVELHRLIGAELLKKVAGSVKRAAGSMALVDAATHLVSNLLSQAQRHVQEAVDLIPKFMQYCSAFGDLLLECLHVMGEGDTILFVRFADVARRLDECRSVVASKAKVEFVPIASRVEELRTHAAKHLPHTLLDSLHKTLEGGASALSYGKCSEVLGQLEPVWLDQPAENKKRLASLIHDMEDMLKTSFDQALSAGEANRLESLVAMAKDIDGRRSALLGSASEFGTCGFAKDLERKKAGVTLTILLQNAGSGVAARSATLHTLFERAEGKLRSMPRERFNAKAETCRWMFKLTSGKFKAYTTEKSAEVEALYQQWLKDGKSNKPEGTRRVEIFIPVEAAPCRLFYGSSPGRDGTSDVGPPLGPSSLNLTVKRPRCPHGSRCYRKNVAHKEEFCHYGDLDWNDEVGTSTALPPPLPPPTASGLSLASEADSVGPSQERYSLDFKMMTQVNLSGRWAMRSIKRSEGLTFRQLHTQEYFDDVVDFVKEGETMFTAVEKELRLLGNAESEGMQTQVSHLLQFMRPALAQFLNLAVLVEDMKVIDEVQALLGMRTQELELDNALKRIRRRYVLDDLHLAYHQESFAGVAPWDLVRLMCKRQPLGGPLYHYRCALIKTKKEIQELTRRHAQIRCQALLSEYDSDEEFKASFRQDAVRILLGIQQKAAKHGPPDVFQNTMRLAARWQCDVGLLIPPSCSYVSSLVAGAVRSRFESVERVVETLAIGSEIAKAAQRTLKDVFDATPLITEISVRVLLELDDLLRGVDYSNRMSSSVNKFVDLRSHVGGCDVEIELDKEFWALFKSHYEAEFVTSADLQTRAVEWAIAVRERLGQALPPWMMTKDQVEAVRKLQLAIKSGGERQLREAAVFAKQADYRSNQQLLQTYDTAIQQLRKLKRLPAGWEVTDLVGDDAKAKMFKRVDLTGGTSFVSFQKLLDNTNLGLVTRDRTGSVPRGYQVKKVESVWNVDAWTKYMKRLDAITEQCKRFPGEAPVTDWTKWNGSLLTSPLGAAILSETNLPDLEPGANEYLMLHGTNPDAANSIAFRSFDMAFACKTGLFGAGIYFAESSSKSDEYVKPNAEGDFPVVICRVALGRIKYCDAKDPTRSPGREVLENSCLRGDFHSVLGDRKKVRGTYREFVVYDHHQVYPHFIVWYSRITG